MSDRRAAFDVLVAAYWQPIYAYLRLRWRQDPEDAEDLTQGFLAAAWTQEFLAAYDPSRARFRTFLRVCLDRHVQNRLKAERAQKRGGGAPVLSLDFSAAEHSMVHREPADPTDTETLFRTEFIRALFARAVERLRAELAARGRMVVFTVFERYDLGPREGVSYATLGRELGVSVTQVTNHLHAARRRFRDIVLDELRELSGSEEEFRAEARDILGYAE